MARSLRASKMSRKNESITLSCTPSDKEALNQLAILHKCTWGTEPNISGLIQKIARGQLALVEGTSEYEISQLMQTREVKRLWQLLQEQFEKID
jgi:hypothetical protein